MVLRRFVRVLALSCALGVLVIPASGARAALLGDALPGTLSPADEPAPCAPATQPFLPWGDTAAYALMPGGSFEHGTPEWTLKGGARVVNGNEPYYVNAAGDSRSLYVPQGGSATTPAMCFAFGDWHLRLFARSLGTTQTTVRVTVFVRSLLGVVSTLDGGTISPSAAWEPSPRVSVLLSNVGGLISTDAISFRFAVPHGSLAAQLDDAYLDPWKDG